MIDGKDTDAPGYVTAFKEADARLLRISAAIKRLPHDAPGAMRAKAAAAFFWSEEPRKTDAHVASEYVCDASAADIIKAAAVTYCPDYVATITAAYKLGEANAARRKAAHEAGLA